MIFIIIDFLRTVLGLKMPAVFAYFSTRMILAAGTSLFLSIFLGPIFIRKLYELKIGQPIRMEDCPVLGQLHEKKKDTPTMGGILILASMLISMFLWMDLTNVFTLILFLTTAILGSLGGYDDFLKLKYKNTRGISARKKLFIQGSVAALLAAYLLCPTITESLHMGQWYSVPVVKEYMASPSDADASLTEEIHQKVLSLQEYAARLYIPFVKDPIWAMGGIFTVLAGGFIIFVVTASSNAVNLTDGLDGLAAGCLIMVASCLALFAFISNHIDLAAYLHILYIEGSGEIAIYLCALIGACLGFLWYNGHPAQVFMGDTGSLALGGVIGVSAVLLKREALLALIGGVFVAETLSVILQVGSYRWRNKKRIFLCTPLHHHFEYQGWPETKVVIRFWIVGLLLALIGIASIKFQ